ncbi:MAG: hypothetical protein WC827_03275 [Candidatus Paceibacterota bacterium]
MKKEESPIVKLLTPYKESKIKEPKSISTKLLKTKSKIIKKTKEKYGGNRKIERNNNISIIILYNFI